MVVVPASKIDELGDRRIWRCGRMRPAMNITRQIEEAGQRSTMTELPRMRSANAAAPSSCRREAEGGDDACVDGGELMERLGDRALFEEVIAIFLDDCPRRLAAIKTAVERSDAALIEETAHILKGAAGNLSATRLFDAARTLERIGANGQLGAAEAAWRQLTIEAAQVMSRLRQFARQGVDG
jgi:HPt (histidine-containing phosphotransfer) domain-containing protein